MRWLQAKRSATEGCYYLRFLRKGKRIWQSVGTDADVAVVSLRNAEHELEGISLGRSASNPSVRRKSAVSLDDAIKSYLAEVLADAPGQPH